MTKLAVRHASTILRYVEQGRKGGTEGGREGGEGERKEERRLKMMQIQALHSTA